LKRSKVCKALKENNFSPKIFYPAKLSFKIEGEIKTLHNKQKLKQHMTTKPPLQKILKGILHTEDENKHSLSPRKGWELLNSREDKISNQRVAHTNCYTTTKNKLQELPHTL
jgi:hypothetical protein